MAGRSLDNLWFGPPTCNFKGHERNTLQGSPIAGITELIDRTSVVGATGVRSAVITSTEHLIHIPCAVSPYLFPIFVRGNRIHRLFQLRFWTLWNLLRYYNFNWSVGSKRNHITFTNKYIYICINTHSFLDFPASSTWWNFVRLWDVQIVFFVQFGFGLWTVSFLSTSSQ